jgi:hypothetical protein
MSDIEITYIEKCLRQIEEQLNWGSSQNWKQRDYEALSDLIFEETKIQLSLSTLKRIWQKRYKQLPQPGTLNALVQFLGYTTWQEFKADHSQKGKTSDLTAFGCNMDEWQKLKVTAKGQSVDIMINDQKVRSFTFSNNTGKIKYLQYRFKGCGRVDDITLSDTLGNIAYTDQF